MRNTVISILMVIPILLIFVYSSVILEHFDAVMQAVLSAFGV